MCENCVVYSWWCLHTRGFRLSRRAINNIVLKTCSGRYEFEYIWRRPSVRRRRTEMSLSGPSYLSHGAGDRHRHVGNSYENTRRTKPIYVLFRCQILYDLDLVQHTHRFEVCIVLALDTRYYGRGASVLGYGHKLDSHRLRILMIYRSQWHDSRPDCTPAAGSSLPNPQASQRATNGRTKIWILVSARRRLEQALRLHAQSPRRRD